ncbi:MAG: hypothetical protein UX26_C0004G0024 [Parcubacteria group bacterium GW2011_GWC1_45_9]|nr:MAG: hypothetical protein UX26_C0004G0024 [Parcubacteria group bacterium GW2011_GWC1_45_9]
MWEMKHPSFKLGCFWGIGLFQEYFRLGAKEIVEPDE